MVGTNTSTRLATQVWGVPETFLTPSFYSETWYDLSVETKFEIKVLGSTKVIDESIFQLWTIKLGECTLKQAVRAVKKQRERSRTGVVGELLAISHVKSKLLNYNLGGKAT